LACAFARAIAKTVEIAEARAAFLILPPKSVAAIAVLPGHPKVQVVVQLKSFADGSQSRNFELPDLFGLARTSSSAGFETKDVPLAPEDLS
jgi:hypothetical protein